MRSPEKVGVLFVANQDLESLPADIDRCVHLSALAAFGNRIDALPPSLFTIDALRSVQVDDNRLTALPDTLGRATGLTRLEANDNYLASLPDAIGELSLLEVLAVEQNRLPALPAGIARLTNLRVLRIGVNPMRALPDLTTSSRLEELCLERLECTNDIARLDLSKLAALQKLVVSGNGLSSLPALPTGLRELVARSNRLATWPDEMPAALARCEVSENDFPSVPASLRTELLDIAYNRVPIVLPPLPGLRALFAGNSRLAALPEGLDALEILQIERSDVRRLPRMPALRRLVAHRDQLESATLGELRARGVEVAIVAP